MDEQILGEIFDIHGVELPAGREGLDLLAELATALGTEVADEHALLQCLQGVHAHYWDRLLDPVLVFTEGDPLCFSLRLPEAMLDKEVQWLLTCFIQFILNLIENSREKMYLQFWYHFI